MSVCIDKVKKDNEEWIERGYQIYCVNLDITPPLTDEREIRWRKAIHFGVKEWSEMNAYTQGYRSAKALVDSLHRLREHPLTNLKEMEELLVKDLRTGLELLGKIRRLMNEAYQRHKSRVNGTEMSLTTDTIWKALSDDEKEQFMKENAPKATFDDLKTMHNPDVIFDSEEEMVQKVYQFPRTTDFIDHMKSKGEAEKGYEPEETSFVELLTNKCGGGVRNIFCPQPGEPGLEEISAVTLIIALFTNPEAFKGSVYDYPKPGYVRSGTWSSPMFHPHRPQKLDLPGSVEESDDPWVKMHKGVEDLTVLKAASVQLLKNKFDLPDGYSFAPDAYYRWKPMPDGEEDQDGYYTMQWAELFDDFNKDLNFDDAFKFWDSYEQRYCRLRYKHEGDGTEKLELREPNIIDSSLHNLCRSPPLGIGRMSYDQHKDMAIFSKLLTWRRRQTKEAHRWKGDNELSYRRWGTYILYLFGMSDWSKR